MANGNQGSGSGRGAGAGGGGRGRNRGGALGPSGYCICVKCNTRIRHQRGVKCTTLKCPECGHVMAREELLKRS